MGSYVDAESDHTIENIFYAVLVVGFFSAFGIGKYYPNSKIGRSFNHFFGIHEWIEYVDVNKDGLKDKVIHNDERNLDRVMYGESIDGKIFYFEAEDFYNKDYCKGR